MIFRKSCRLWDNVKNMVEPDRSQMTGRIWFAWRISKAIIHTHTLLMCNTYCFSTETVITRTRLKVTLYVHWLSCFRNSRNCPPPPYLYYRIMKICKTLIEIMFVWSSGEQFCTYVLLVVMPFSWTRGLRNQECWRQTVPELVELMTIL
jgi:hypothetical protein